MSFESNPPLITPDIIKKLDISGPRYTSYPTAPEWSDQFNETDYRSALMRFNPQSQTLSVYVHIPFCTQMCFYCGCNVTIRKTNNNIGHQYIDYVEREIKMITEQWSENASITQLHWGGGTPNFLSIDELSRLKGLFDTYFSLSPSAEVSIEVDPRTVSNDQIDALARLGFNRISMGIQDFDSAVQHAINRAQSVESVTQLFDTLRRAGFSSINVDLIYGLPHQTVTNFFHTVNEIIRLKPDRIALYSYAHVPWLKSHQRLISESDLPDPDEKLAIFAQARQQFLSAGYDAVGMDHFALPSDELAIAFKNGELYRNFMGYTTNPADDAIGLGVSSIGYVGGAFVQNTKTLAEYYSAIDANSLPTERGLRLTHDDQIRRWVIQSIMCRFTLDETVFFETFGVRFSDYFQGIEQHLDECIANGLIHIRVDGFDITTLGRFFVRNVAMGFDAYLKASPTRRFSQTI